MRYFIEDIKTYKSVNKKGQALQDFVTPLEQYLVADELSLDALKANIDTLPAMLIAATAASPKAAAATLREIDAMLARPCLIRVGSPIFTIWI